MLSKRSYCSTILLVALVATLWFSACSKQTSPRQALEVLRNSENTEELISAGKTLIRKPSVRDWGLVELANALLENEEPSLAVDYYSKVDENSAASLDSRLGIIMAGLKIDSASKTDYQKVEQELSTIEALASSKHRKDLLPSVFLTKAHLFSLAGSTKESERFLLQLCEGHPGSSEFPEAFRLLKQLNPEPSIATLSEWAGFLSKAGRFEESLDLTKKGIAQAKENSKGQLELFAQHERTLRKLGKKEEADEILNRMASSATEGIADQALLRLGMNAWNINEHQEALEWFKKISINFPKSSLSPKVNYLRGRILEELKEFDTAKNIYEKIVSSFEKRKTNSLSALEKEYYLKAAKRLPWIEIVRGNKEDGRVQMGKLQQLAKTLSNRELEIHANFWKNYKAEQTYSNREKLDLADVDFYSIQSGTPELAPKEKSCRAELPKKLVNRLSSIKKLQFREFATREINWSLADKMPSKSQSWGLADLEKVLSIAELHSEFADPSDSIKLANLALSKLKNNPQLKHKCLASIQQILYPAPFVKHYNSLADKYRLSPSLLLAITRTESHFNPQAISRVGARGLMQLMPNTAKIEGLKEGESLFNPMVNISLGSKHLSRLMDQYDGEEIYAIAAYNAGTEAVNRWIKRYPNLSPIEWSELIGYPETLNYVKKVSYSAAIYTQVLARKWEN